MRKETNLHPNTGGNIGNSPVDNSDENLENYQYEKGELVPLFILRKRIRDLITIVPLELENLSKEDIYKIISKHDPRFNLDFDNMKTVTNSKFLIDKLNLMLEYNSLFGKKEYLFDEKLLYDKDFFRWRKLIFDKDAYLKDDSNYYKLDESMLREENSSATILRNSRVLLYWKGLELDKTVVKRILTLGLSYIIGHISKAELLFKIRNNLPMGMYEVTVKGDRYKFIIITIYNPVTPLK